MAAFIGALIYPVKPVLNRKHHYAQAFAIYGLSEYYRATGQPESLELAQSLFRLLEKHAYRSGARRLY